MVVHMTVNMYMMVMYGGVDVWCVLMVIYNYVNTTSYYSSQYYTYVLVITLFPH